MKGLSSGRTLFTPISTSTCCIFLSFALQCAAENARYLLSSLRQRHPVHRPRSHTTRHQLRPWAPGMFLPITSFNFSWPSAGLTPPPYCRHLLSFLCRLVMVSSDWTSKSGFWTSVSGTRELTWALSLQDRPWNSGCIQRVLYCKDPPSTGSGVKNNLTWLVAYRISSSIFRLPRQEFSCDVVPHICHTYCLLLRRKLHRPAGAVQNFLKVHFLPCSCEFSCECFSIFLWNVFAFLSFWCSYMCPLVHFPRSALNLSGYISPLSPFSCPAYFSCAVCLLMYSIGRPPCWIWWQRWDR